MCLLVDDIRGSVHKTQKITLGPFENTTLSGILKGPVKNSTYHKCVNVSVEPLRDHKERENNFCTVPGYTFLKPGSDRVMVMIKNLTARTIKVEQGSKVASMEVANVVPHMLVPQGTASLRNETKTMKSMNIRVLQKDSSTTMNEGTEQCATSMCVDDVGPSENPIEAAAS